MDQKMIGSMISYERGKKKISAQALADGICSVSAVQRLETGERLPDYFVLERMLERLGKSVNKIEFMYDESAYEIYYLRALIERYMEEDALKDAKGALAYYEGLPVAKESLHRQYIFKMKAVIASEKEGEHAIALELFAKALEETVPNFSFKDMDERLLGEEELAILLLWLQEKIQMDAVSIELDGDRVLSYIDRFCDDEEVKINIYSKATWVIGTMTMKKGNCKKALQYTLQGEKVLAENGVLIHLPQFLDRILFLTESVELESYEEWKKQRDALKKIYEEYNEPWDAEKVQLWKNYRQQEIYLISEAIGQGRKVTNESQEEIADALDMDQKTISRIERGKYKPKIGTFQKLREHLQIERDVCSTRIAVEDFRLLEIERQISKLSSNGKMQEAEALYIQLKEKLDMTWKENQQYVKYLDVVFDRQFNRITYADAIEPCVEAYYITRKGNTFEQIKNLKLSRTETFILNFIAICYRRMGEREKAIKLLEHIVKSYENSKVDLKYHYPAVSIVYAHLADLYEEVDRFDDSVLWCNKSIAFEIECKRGIDIGRMLTERQYALDRKNGEHMDSKDVYMCISAY